MRVFCVFVAYTSICVDQDSKISPLFCLFLPLRLRHLRFDKFGNNNISTLQKQAQIVDIPRRRECLITHEKHRCRAGKKDEKFVFSSFYSLQTKRIEWWWLLLPINVDFLIDCFRHWSFSEIPYSVPSRDLRLKNCEKRNRIIKASDEAKKKLNCEHNLCCAHWKPLKRIEFSSKHKKCEKMK